MFMHRTWSFFVLLMGFALFLSGIEGCLSQHPSVDRNEGFYVETVPSSRVSLSRIAVKRESAGIVILGEVRRRNTAFSGLGHVDVAVISPDGAVIGQGNAPYFPRVLPKTPGARKHPPSHFEVHLNCSPPRGTTIRVAYHGKPEANDPLDPGENFAVPKQQDHGG